MPPPPSSLQPHSCQRSLELTQIGWFYWVNEEKGQRVLIIDMHFLLGGDTFLWNTFLTRTPIAFSSPPSSPIPCPGYMHIVKYNSMDFQFLKIIQFLKVSCHFSTCDLWVCFVKCVILPPGRKAGREADSRKAESSQWTFHSDSGSPD